MMIILRYFLPRGRMAELRVPADLDAAEKARLFAHLQVDLLDGADHAYKTATQEGPHDHRSQPE